MLDVNELKELVTANTYEVVVQSYESVEPKYPQIVELRDISETNLYGVKGSVLEGVGGFRDREDYQEADSDQPGKAYTWQAAVRQKSRRLDISQRMLDSLGTAGKVVDYVSRQVQHWGVQALRAKEEEIAGMLQKGTLTAGNLKYFDDSFPDNDDPNPGFIYDGLPLFDTAHTLSGSSDTYSNHTVSAPLTSANLQTVLNTMRDDNALDDRGDRIDIMPDTLIVPVGQEFTARQILNSVNLPGTGNNDVNPIAGMLRIVTNPYLSDAASADSWWVAQTQGSRALRMWDSGLPVVETHYDPISKTLSVIAEIHYAACATDARLIYAANKAAS